MTDRLLSGVHDIPLVVTSPFNYVVMQQNGKLVPDKNYQINKTVGKKKN